MCDKILIKWKDISDIHARTMNQDVLNAIQNLTRVLDQYNNPQPNDNHVPAPAPPAPVPPAPVPPAPVPPAPEVAAGVAENPVGITEIIIQRGSNIKITLS